MLLETDVYTLALCVCVWGESHEPSLGLTSIREMGKGGSPNHFFVIVMLGGGEGHDVIVSQSSCR